MVHYTGVRMIFLHRQNNIKTFTEAIEVDVRSSPNGLVLNHDRLNFDDDYPLVYDLISLTNTVIFNVKESGVEEELIEFCDLINSNNSLNLIEFYFLDSQIPDIIRISKQYPQHAHRFIIRVSDMETLNLKLMNLVKPKYIWVDYTEFDSFSIEDYIKYVNCVDSVDSVELIIVSPELYSLDYLDIAKDIAKFIKSKQLNRYNVCTKYPELYEELGCST